jgi:signal transduction histidine kinase
MPRHSTEESNFLMRLIGPAGADMRKRAVVWVLVAAAYFLTGQIGLYLYRDIGTSPAFIWPPVGIAISAVLLEGYWIGSAIAVGAILNAFFAGAPLFIILGSMVGNTIQPLVGGYVLRKFSFNPLLNSIRDVFILTCVAVSATVIAPLIGYGFTYVYDAVTGASRALPVWPQIWMGGALSALILIPFLTRWIGLDLAYRTRAQQLELMVSVMLVSVLSYVIFATAIPTVFSTSLLLLLLASLFWISFRVGPRAMSLALLMLTAISLAGAIYGVHMPSTATLGSRLISTEVLDLILAFFFFILVSVEEQRKDAIRNLSLDAERLESALETIRAEERAKNEFIATLAHELRNPLAPIMSGLELLKLDETRADKIEILESAQRQSFMMRRLLDELLDVARIARKSFALKKEHVPLQKILKESVDSVLHVYKEKHQTFSSIFPDDEVWIHGDPIRLTQVFTNILFNAAKYTEEGGHIFLELKKEDGLAIINIQDTGSGITKDMLSRIFDPFVQDSRRAEANSGLGIGLSIAKRLLDLHEGTVSATSEGKNRGSTFTITLPTIRTQSKNAAAMETAIGVKSSVLVVDDNKDAAHSMARLLRARGNTVEMAFSGQGALDALSKRPNYVLLDIGLPDMEGHVVAKEIRSRLPETTVIALSGYGSKDDKRKAQEAGIAIHLTKPASLRDIEAAMASASRA